MMLALQNVRWDVYVVQTCAVYSDCVVPEKILEEEVYVVPNALA